MEEFKQKNEHGENVNITPYEALKKAEEKVSHIIDKMSEASGTELNDLMDEMDSAMLDAREAFEKWSKHTEDVLKEAELEMKEAELEMKKYKEGINLDPEDSLNNNQ